MKAEIIIIGNEILTGYIVDTNSAYISQQLFNIGVDVIRKTNVGDFVEDIKEAVDAALKRADIVIATGGLGPTVDDVTKAAVADYFGRELVRDDDVLEDIKKRFQESGKIMPKCNVGQAMIPEGFEILQNRYGTAPGLCIREQEKMFFVMPGVPFEMKALLDEQILPILEGYEKRKNVLTKEIYTTGISESELGERVSAINLDREIKIGFYPSPYGVNIRLSIFHQFKEVASEILNEAVQEILGTVGRFIYSTEGNLMEEVVGRLLKERNLMLAIAESCTGGLIGNRITNISGSSKYFEGGIVSYGNDCKTNILGVSQETIDKFGAVSKPTAQAMAEGVRKVCETHIGIGVTGIAGPTGGTIEKPVGTVFIALSAENFETCEKFSFGARNLRLKIKMRSSQAALNMIRLYLEGYYQK